MEDTKVCTKCQQELPIGEFNKKKLHCKGCQRKANQELSAHYRGINASRFQSIEWMRTEKRCPRCKQLKRHYDFSRDITSNDGCHSRCQVCDREEQRIKSKSRTKWELLRHGAQTRRKVLTLSEEQYNLLIESNSCLYCDGTLPTAGCGLDRIDNSRGYEPGNVVPCCTACNLIRGDILTHEQMLMIGPQLMEFRLEREAASRSRSCARPSSSSPELAEQSPLEKTEASA